MSDNKAYAEISFEILELALREAFGLPAESHVLDVMIKHDFITNGLTRTPLVLFEDPVFNPVQEGEQVPRKIISVQSKRWGWK